MPPFVVLALPILVLVTQAPADLKRDPLPKAAN